MPPALSQCDIADGLEADAIFLGESHLKFASLMPSPNLDDLLGRELGAAVRLSKLASSASLGVSIPIILGNGAQAKMRWIYAAGIVASMHHAEAIWDWPIGQLPGDTMCQERGAAIVLQPSHDLSVPTYCARPRPIPAAGGIGFVAARPESIRDGSWFGAGAALCGRLRLHRKFTPFGAKPEGVPASLGHSYAHYIRMELVHA